jgi:hypothetical protein
MVNNTHTLKSEREGTPSRGERNLESVSEVVKTSSFPHIPFKLILGILIVLCLAGFLFIMIGNNEGQKCLKNPLLYGANKMTNEDTGNLLCTCSLENPRYAQFYFNNEEVNVLEDLAK